MPIKTGLEAIREIRQIPELHNTTIVAVSASAIDFDEFIVGCEAFLSKPVNEKQLLNLLQEHLHLDWTYESTAELTSSRIARQKSPAQILIAPPPQEMTILHELAMLGSMKKIRERAIYLEKLDEQFAPLAAQLKNLANTFQEKAIIDLVEQHLPQQNK